MIEVVRISPNQRKHLVEAVEDLDLDLVALGLLALEVLLLDLVAVLLLDPVVVLLLDLELALLLDHLVLEEV